MTSLYGPAEDTGASATPSGSRPTGQAPTGLDATRFDPSRWRPIVTAPRHCVILASGLDWGDGPNRHIAFATWDDEQREWRDAAQESQLLHYLTHWLAVEDIPHPAIATEAGTAETTKIGSVHEGAVAKPIAQSQPSGNPLDTGDGK